MLWKTTWTRPDNPLHDTAIIATKVVGSTIFILGKYFFIFNNKMGKLIIDKNKSNTFTRSKCGCKFCTSTHNIVDNKWHTFIPKSPLQYRMMNVIKNIEKKYCL